ncbi:solute carrier family 35 member G1-like [Amblyomma americanum]
MGMALWTSVALCLCGVVIVMRPTIIFEEWNADTTQARLTGFLYAFGSSLALVALIILVRVTQTATSRFVSFNSGLTRTVLVIFMAMASGDFDLFLDGRFLATLVMMGKLSFCTIYFLNKALLTESGAFVATIKFSGDIILSVILQMAFLDLYPDMWTLGGIALVVLSFLMIACQNIVPSLWERRRQRRASRARRQTLKSTDDEGTSAAADNL